MRSFFPVIFAAVAFCILGGINLVLLRLLHPDWWRMTWVRRTTWIILAGGPAMVAVWGIAEYNGLSTGAFGFAALSALLFVLQVSLMLSLPFSGLLHLASKLIDRFRRRAGAPAPRPADENRRLFLKATAAALPIVTVAAGVKGVGWSFAGASMTEHSYRFPTLPTQLEGLKILQISDLHLHHYITLDHLAELLDEARKLEPDVVFLTGDVSDDLKQLPDALRMVDALKPRLGTYAILGNHEYFRGIREVRHIYDRSPVPLLVDRAVEVKVDGSSLVVAGIDDPRSMSGVTADFFDSALDRAYEGMPADAFSVLLSHRPNVLPYAAQREIPLVLAGHTHGGQIGFLGRSLFEPMFPKAYLWGEYREGNSLLYTTCGAGHWFPFRLGCPREVPLITLRRA